ncbi:methyltransferase [Penicillium macrosclerotiorum]|uniref:methyltransferase n=1 Tax=Penicillium macrosclerotiorum TaxID=303699 RepID=UPI002547F52B|nr:methyltransferase [Penicillium macrosclerotiorum]KAJ5678962.1 methyltransferase [Penicillium macrosclerotiorum]
MLLKGELHLAPVKNPVRVLDLGTGTGIWAIDFAEVPPNCQFEVDDFEQPWSYTQPFDFIHGRELEGAIRNHDCLFRRAFDNLSPNGWFEMSSMEVNTYSDDNTHLNAKCMLESVVNMHAGSRAFGKDMASVLTWKEKFEKAGFVNVREEVYKLPQSPWPKDPKLKELGRYHQLNMLEAMGPYSYALFTRVLGWDRVRIEALLAGVRHELRDLSNHLYSKVHIIYGQRPK